VDIFSANAAPITLGVISLKIMIKKAIVRVAMERTRPFVPNKWSAIPGPESAKWY
jgi:hypothetical protein